MSLRFILIGHPVGHSVSPAMHTAAYAELKLDASYLPVDCPNEASVRAQVDRLRSGEIHGANVTVPHKLLALSLADHADPLAVSVGAANVLRRMPDGSVEAHNTDVAALAEELEQYQPLTASGSRNLPQKACVLGSGGAALAAVAACRRMGVSTIYVAARAFSGGNANSLLQAKFQELGGTPLGLPADVLEKSWQHALKGVGLVVQATSAGMRGAEPGETLAGLIPWNELDAGALAYDLVYNPPVTPFLREAGKNGVHAVGGLGMLVGQAVLSIELWTGRKASPQVLREAAERVLFPSGVR